MIYHHLISHKLITSTSWNELIQLKFMRWVHRVWIFFLLRISWSLDLFFFGEWSMDDCRNKQNDTHRPIRLGLWAQSSWPHIPLRPINKPRCSRLVGRLPRVLSVPAFLAHRREKQLSTQRPRPPIPISPRALRFAPPGAACPPSDWLFLCGFNPWAPGAASIRTRPRCVELGNERLRLRCSPC